MLDAGVRTCAHERRVDPLPFPTLRIDPLPASPRFRVEIHLDAADERPPEKRRGGARGVQIATEREAVLQGAADEDEDARGRARSVPPVREVGDTEGARRNRRGRRTVRPLHLWAGARD